MLLGCVRYRHSITIIVVVDRLLEYDKHLMLCCIAGHFISLKHTCTAPVTWTSTQTNSKPRRLLGPETKKNARVSCLSSRAHLIAFRALNTFLKLAKVKFELDKIRHLGKIRSNSEFGQTSLSSTRSPPWAGGRGRIRPSAPSRHASLPQQHRRPKHNPLTRSTN